MCLTPEGIECPYYQHVLKNGKWWHRLANTYTGRDPALHTPRPDGASLQWMLLGYPMQVTRMPEGWLYLVDGVFLASERTARHLFDNSDFGSAHKLIDDYVKSDAAHEQVYGRMYAKRVKV